MPLLSHLTRSGKVLAALAARLATQGFAGHSISFEAGFAPSSSPFGSLFYIFSGASTPSRARPFFSTLRAASASFSRAASTAGASPLMRQAV